MNEQLSQFYSQLSESISDGSFIKSSLSNYKGAAPGLKNIFIKKILLKQAEYLSFVYRYQTTDITKNYSLAESFAKIKQEIEAGFNSINLFTANFDLNLERKKGKFFLKRLSPSLKLSVQLGHDKDKKRLISTEDKKYLCDLQITDEKGMVYKNAQDKFRQINRYIELLDPLIRQISKKDVNIVDMGSGKGYLTFALYDYLTNIVGKAAHVTGVEARRDMVDLCNQIATKSDFSRLSFVHSDIAGYQKNDIDILIALHACDTATDDAIYKGIRANANLIVVAPCCHKQIRRQIEQTRKKNELNFITDYGIFLERQAEMATDGLRALLLNYSGYETKIIEFISSEHTAKNIMIIAIKSGFAEKKKAEAYDKFLKAKKFYGIESHYLESLLQPQ